MKRIFIIFFILSGYLLTSQDIVWEQAGESAFPDMDTLWYRAKRAGGIGRVTGIAVDPENYEHVFIGTFGGGVWETRNALDPSGKVEWKCLTDTLPAHIIPEVKFLNGKLYACTNNRIMSKYTTSLNKKYGLGVMVLHPDGKWQISKTTFPCYGFDVVRENDKTIIYASSDDKIYKSEDDAKTWKELKSFSAVVSKEPGFLYRVVIHPQHPERIIVSRNGVESLLYYSADAGKTWKDITAIFEDYFELIPEKKKKKTTVELQYEASEKQLYLALRKSSKVYILKTGDWEHFEPYNYGKTPLSVSPMFNTAFCRTGTNDMLFGATFLHKIIGGKKVVNISRGQIHDDIRALILTPGDSLLYIGHDGGISISEDLGNTYRNITGNLNLFQVFGMAYAHVDQKRYITIGVQDGTWYRMDRDGNKRWRLLSLCCEGAAYSRFDDAETLFLNNNLKLVKAFPPLISPKPGRRLKTKPLVKMADGDAPVTFHPENKEVLVFSKYFWPGKGNPYGSTLFISYDYGETKEQIPRIEGNTPYMWGRPSAMKYSKAQTNVFYMATLYFKPGTSPFKTRVHLYKSENMNDKIEDIRFIDLSDDMSGIEEEVLTSGPINDLCIDDDNPDRLWICFGNLIHGKKIYESYDGGITWENITYNLPDFPVNELVYDSDAEILYAGTDTGVYFLDSGEWKSYGKALPVCMVSDMLLDPVSRELIIATYGRGVWIAPLWKPCKNFIVNKRTVIRSDMVVCGDIIIGEKGKLIIKQGTLRGKSIRNPHDRKIKIRNKGRLILNDQANK